MPGAASCVSTAASSPGPPGSAPSASPAGAPEAPDAALAASVAAFLALSDRYQFAAEGDQLLERDAQLLERDGQLLERDGEPRVVDGLGCALGREGARAQLRARYAAAGQLAAVSEAALRVDAELELLRRRCFAERNARWASSGLATAGPTGLELGPPPPRVEPAWDPQPANDKLALLAAADAAARKPGALAASLAPAVPRPALDGFPVGDFARNRPWPPKEFGVKSVIKPIRSKGGKRKSPAAIIAAAAAAAAQTPSSPFPRACVDCRTQATPLWRSRVRKKTVTVPVAVLPTIPGVTLQPDGTLLPANGAPVATTRQQEVEEHLDLCMQCYLKTERKDLFDRRKQDKNRKEREKRERAAAEKKQMQLLKKQQRRQQLKQQQQDAQAAGNPAATVDLAAPAAAIQGGVVETPAGLKFTKDELDVALERNALRKEKKKSHHDKKKKKKKKRKLEHYDDSDTDGLTPMPSPPQMARYEYADITHPSHDDEGSFEHHQYAPVEDQPMIDSDADRSRSKRKRDSKRKGSDGGSSKKRRSVDGPSVDVHPTISISPSAPTPSRSSRSKAVATPTATVPTPSSSKKKRNRGKKESNRERELRALGQYCPVCNEVYEDDDDSSFVCCDSCEMWVHTACDSTLTPYVLALCSEIDSDAVLTFYVYFIQGYCCSTGKSRREVHLPTLRRSVSSFI